MQTPLFRILLAVGGDQGWIATVTAAFREPDPVGVEIGTTMSVVDAREALSRALAEPRHIPAGRHGTPYMRLGGRVRSTNIDMTMSFARVDLVAQGVAPLHFRGALEPTDEGSALVGRLTCSVPRWAWLLPAVAIVIALIALTFEPLASLLLLVGGIFMFLALRSQQRVRDWKRVQFEEAVPRLLAEWAVLEPGV